MQNNTTNSNKRTKRNTIVSIMLVFALLIVSALAFLTATDSKTNVFSVGNVDIELWEDFDTNGDGELSDGESYGPEDGQDIAYIPPVSPTEKIIKAPYMKNVGKNDSFVFMTVGIPVIKCKMNSIDTTGEEKEFFTLEGLSDDWSVAGTKLGYVAEDGSLWNYYLYAYDGILPGSSSEPDPLKRVTPKLFEEVRVIDFYEIVTSEEKVKTNTIDSFGAAYTAIPGYDFYNIPDINTIEEIENSVVNYTYAATPKQCDFTGMSTSGLVVPFSEGMAYLGIEGADNSYDSYVFLYMYDGLTCAFSLYPNEVDIDLNIGGMQAKIKPGLSVSTNTTSVDQYSTSYTTIEEAKLPINAYAVQTKGGDITDAKSALDALISEEDEGGFLGEFECRKTVNLNYFVPEDVVASMSLPSLKTIPVDVQPENDGIIDGNYCMVKSEPFFEGDAPNDYYSSTSFDVLEAKSPSKWMLYDSSTKSVSEFNEKATLTDETQDIDLLLSYDDKSVKYDNLVPQKYYVYAIECLYGSGNASPELIDYDCVAHFAGISEDYFTENNIPVNPDTGAYPAVSVKLPAFVPFQWKEDSQRTLHVDLENVFYEPFKNTSFVNCSGMLTTDNEYIRYFKNDYGYYVEIPSSNLYDSSYGYPVASGLTNMIPVSGGSEYMTTTAFGPTAKQFSYDYFYFEPEITPLSQYRNTCYNAGSSTGEGNIVSVNISCNTAEISPAVEIAYIDWHDSSVPLNIDKFIAPDSVEAIFIPGHVGTYLNGDSDLTVNEYQLGSSLAYFSYMDNQCGYKTLSISPDNTTFCSVNNMLYSKDKTQLWAYPTLNSNKPAILASTSEIYCGEQLNELSEIPFAGTKAQLEDVLYCSSSAYYIFTGDNSARRSSFTFDYATDEDVFDGITRVLDGTTYVHTLNDFPFTYPNPSGNYSHTSGFNTCKHVCIRDEEVFWTGGITGKIGDFWLHKMSSEQYRIESVTPYDVPFVCSNGTVVYRPYGNGLVSNESDARLVKVSP